MPRVLFVSLLAVLAAPASPLRAGEPLSYERDVRPVLKAHCFQCHGEGKVRGGLDVRLRRLLAKGGSSGPAIVPGKAAESLLLERLRDGEMPPREIHVRPTAQEIERIARWVDSGAPTARPEPADVARLPAITEEERSFWSFRPIQRPTAPAARQAGLVRTPIDAFLLARLEEKGLSFGPQAERRTLLRRASLDLTGLPPAPDEVQRFLADERPDAYERLIDRLLASPHYGERWGRHWLDVAGYADSEGYNDEDTVREHAWRYRDYVIRAFNDDMHFDRFIREQLAGDEMVRQPHRNLNPDEVEKLTATGFLRMAPDGTGTRNDDPDLAKNTVITETIKIVSSALLGVTVGCAECHDHRFDPILQEDFYRLRAVLEPALSWKSWRESRRRLISLLSDEERREQARLEAEAKKVEAALQVKLKEYQAWVFAKEVEALPADLREAGRAAGLAWQKDPRKLTKEQQKLLASYPSLQVGATTQRLNLFLAKYGRNEELAKDVKENAERAAAVRARKPREGMVRALTEVPGEVPVTHLFLRGNSATPGHAVEPGDLAALHADKPLLFPADDPALPTTGRRLAFARRLTDGKHPLVPRVLVNRFWMHHFGQGIVATPGDFGRQGEPPSHPELLDWLASEFMDNGWSLKHLHRVIMTSTAYRQSSARRPEGERVDADNRLLWRMPVRRLEAEALRDAMLAVSGRLCRDMGGPPIPVGVDGNSQVVVGDPAVPATGQEDRRSVYVQVRRSLPPYLLSVFDAPQMEPNCESRNVSTVAPQSLLLMNSAFILEQARHLAVRTGREAGAVPRAQVVHAWRLVYAAEPTADDVDALVQYLAQQQALLRERAGKKAAGEEVSRDALASLCQVLLGSNRFVYVD